nr:unnamed protein product [Callosobruchus analis]
MPGDVIQADRGFLIEEHVRLFNAQLHMPDFTKRKKQLHPLEIEKTRSIAQEKYTLIIFRIPFATEHVARMEMYDMNRVELIKALVHKAECLKDALIQHCVKHYQQMCTTVGEEYQALSDKVLTVPEDTAALMALKKYVDEVETKILPAMEDRLRDVMTYIIFLADHIIFTPVEMKEMKSYIFLTLQFEEEGDNANSIETVLKKYLHMPKVMEEHRQLVTIKTEEFQSLLTVKIQKFQDDLEMYAKMVDELQNNGNIKDLAKYHRKATKLNERLVQAMQTIDKFNGEESSFGFDLSQYPLRKQVHDKLTPYKKLYDNATDFLNKCELWMKSRVGTYDPKEVEADTATFYNNIYHLEKTLSEKPATQELAVTVRERIEEFKGHMPIIQTLGNPGMKERHWEKVSEIVGFPIKLDAELTLEKIIDYGLDEYVDKFEAISEAATKENNLEKNLSKMILEWQDMKFTALIYRDTGTYILSAVDEIQVLLDDHIVKTQTMKNSPYIKPFEQKILSWEAKLVLLQEILDEWLKVQSTWIYLEPIFSSPDIQQQMPEEGRRFSAVDKVSTHLF